MENLDAHECIARKIDEQDPHTAPKDANGNISRSFIAYLKQVYSPEEADIIKHLNLMEDFSMASDIAHAAGRELAEVEKILSDVHSRSAIVGLEGMYCLPPVPLLVNIHQFSIENRPGDIEAARLYQEFFIKEEFFRFYEASKTGTPMARIIPIKKSIDAEQKVLAAEEAHDYIRNHSEEELTMVPCPCRARTEKLGIRECHDRFPIAACIMMGPAAVHFEMTGLGKRVTKDQAIRYFDEMVELGLVGQTFNARHGDMVICLCCGCCCSQMRGRTRWGNDDAMLPANFVPRPGDDCLGCGVCTERCMLGALTLDDETDQVTVDEDKCIGCGVCTLGCPQETLKLYRYERSTPQETSKILLDTVFQENRT